MTEIERPAALQGLKTFVVHKLTAPVDVASLAAFRILFGLLMAGAMIRFLVRGWVNQVYIEPRFHFPWQGFGWVHPLPGPGMQGLFVLLALVGLMISIGFCYRASILLFFLGFTYVELIDQSVYLNHYYLISLLSALMIFLPAHRIWSLDAWRRSVPEVAHAWTVHLLRFQLSVVYIFAGLAKLNADWLLKAQPLRIWLSARSDFPLLGAWLQEPWVAYAASWSGAIFDLTIVFFLLRPKTRRFAFLVLIVFHAGTWLLFNIGMFPWIMIAAATLFFPPDWPRHLLSHCPAWAGRWARRLFRTNPASAQARGEGPARLLPPRHPRLLSLLLVVYMTGQIALPLRPYLFGGGHPAWSYRGFNFAWQVMVAEKTGFAEFYALDPVTGQRTRIGTREYLSPRQETLMAQDPHLIRSLARKISADLEEHGRTNIPIVVNAFATLNGRPSQRIIDPQIDLANVGGQDWILPLGAPP